MQDNAFHYRFTTLILDVLKKKGGGRRRKRTELNVTLDFCCVGTEVSLLAKCKYIVSAPFEKKISQSLVAVQNYVWNSRSLTLFLKILSCRRFKCTDLFRTTLTLPLLKDRLGLLKLCVSGYLSFYICMQTDIYNTYIHHNLKFQESWIS